MTKKKSFPKFLSVVILFVVIYGSIELTGAMSLKAKKLKEYRENETKIEALEKDIKNIKETIKDSGSEEFVEKVARSEYKMVKPREVIYLDKDKEKK